MLRKSIKAFALLACLSLVISCSKKSIFKLSSDGDAFKSDFKETRVKVDVLWIIDNSGSMATSQDALAANFQSFIAKFQESNFDFQMAVGTTEAWLEPGEGPVGISRFRDGNDDDGPSGFTVIDKNTPNLESVFVQNVRQGITGDGDERGLQSLTEILSNPDNANDGDGGFPRADSLLAVIFLSDEDDFSHDGNEHVQGNYNNPDLHPVSQYYDYLYSLTNSTPEQRNFLVNTIAIIDDQCREQLDQGQGFRIIAQRYIELTDMTNGNKGSLCDDFSDVMSGISDTILQFTTKFRLSRLPIVETIKVYIDNELVPMDPVNGWTYVAEDNSIIFGPNAIPGNDSQVVVTFDPAGIK